MLNFFFSSVIYRNILGLITSKNLTKLYNFGFILLLFWIIQIISGVLLAFSYQNLLSLSSYFLVSEFIDIQGLFIVRGIHISGTSTIFFCMYLHMFKIFIHIIGEQRHYLTYVIGIILYVLTVIIAFLGYVLPCSQMSYWGLTVFWNILAAVPLLGPLILFWFWGAEFICDNTLSKVLTLHIFLPTLSFLIILAHLIALHLTSSSDSLSDRGTTSSENIFFFSYTFIRDIFAIILLFLFVLYMILIYWDFVFHEESFIFASITSTPEKIIPEWFFLTFFGLIKCIPYKFIGIIILVSVLTLIFTGFFLTISKWYSIRNIHINKFMCIMKLIYIIGMCSTAVNLTYPVLELLRIAVLFIIITYSVKIC